MPERQTTKGCSRIENRCTDRIYQHLQEAEAPLAMGYIPDQRWSQTFELCRALQAGTIFPCLYKPFCGKGGKWR